MFLYGYEPGPDNPEHGTFECPYCYSFYEFRWDGQLWTFQLLERRSGEESDD